MRQTRLVSSLLLGMALTGCGTDGDDEAASQDAAPSTRGRRGLRPEHGPR